MILKLSNPVAALLLLLGGPAWAETVKVGVVLSYSGDNAEIAQKIDRAIDLYVHTHPDELGTNKVELIKRDSGPPDGAGAKTQVTELITRDKVSMVIGFVFSPDAIATAPVVTKAKVPMIVVNAGTAWITTLSPYIVRTSYSIWQSSYLMGDYAAKKMGCTTSIVAYTAYPPGKDTLDAFKLAYEKAGGKLIDQIPTGSAEHVPDYTPYMQRVMSEKPDCLYVFVPSGAHTAAMITTAKEVGLQKSGIKFIGPLDIGEAAKIPEVGDAAVGAFMMGHYGVEYDNPANAAFVKSWHEAYGKDYDPNFTSVAGWDGMAAIYHVIKTLNGKIDPDRAMAALKGWKTESPRGPIMIDPETRDIIQDEHVEQIVKVDGHTAVKVLETIPAVKDPCKELKIGKCAG